MVAPSADEQSPSHQNPSPHIHLEQFLKISGIAGTGGQAKVMIQAGEVEVNSHVETRRKRKLFPGDTVRVSGEILIVESDDSP